MGYAQRGVVQASSSAAHPTRVELGRVQQRRAAAGRARAAQGSAHGLGRQRGGAAGARGGEASRARCQLGNASVCADSWAKAEAAGELTGSCKARMTTA